MQIKSILGHKVNKLTSEQISTMANWLTVADYIYSKDVDKQIVVNMLAHELKYKHRDMIIKRLCTRLVRFSTDKTTTQLMNELYTAGINIKY